MELGSYYHNRDPSWTCHTAHMPMSLALRHLYADWLAHPRPIRFPEMAFGRTLKKALNRNHFSIEVAACRALARDRPQRQLLIHSTPMPSTLMSYLPTPNQSPANPSALILGYGNLALDYVAPI
jgi:hypothetical protein